MKIKATLVNRKEQHQVRVTTNEKSQVIASPGKAEGGSQVNGGELLFLALATCFCNDLYREAKKRGIPVHGVEVEVTGDFDAEGAAAKNITYRVKVDAEASDQALQDLIAHTDRVTEIQNTVREATPVKLVTS